MSSTQAKQITQFIQLRGSTTVLSPIQIIGSHYMDEFPDVGLPLLGGGTTIGYKTVLDATTDIGMASGAMPEEMAISSRTQKIAVRTIDIAYDAIAVIVNPLNPISDFSLEQLKEVFTGKFTDWKELGRYAGKINVYSHHPHRGTYEPWKRLVIGQDHITLGANVVSGHLELFEKLAHDPYGISYVSSTFLGKAKVKVASVNGVLPTYENLSANTYPIRNNLMLVTREKTSEQVNHFIEYCLNPEKGQAMIQKAGLVPVKRG